MCMPCAPPSASPAALPPLYAAPPSPALSKPGCLANALCCPLFVRPQQARLPCHRSSLPPHSPALSKPGCLASARHRLPPPSRAPSLPCPAAFPSQTRALALGCCCGRCADCRSSLPGTPGIACGIT
eukprot:364310-Chlamydomonas_euryale.AAC.2